MSTKKTKFQKLSIAELGCAFLWNPCDRAFVRPLPGSSFERVEYLASFGRTSLAAFARQQGIALKTIHNRISRGELGEEHGMQKRRGRWIVVDPIRLEQALKTTK